MEIARALMQFGGAGGFACVAGIEQHLPWAAIILSPKFASKVAIR